MSKRVAVQAWQSGASASLSLVPKSRTAEALNRLSKAYPNIDRQVLTSLYLPMAAWLADWIQGDGPSPPMVALSGLPGTGKSTLSSALQVLLHGLFDLELVAFSLDDVYLTRQEREVLATSVHPLLRVRGVPGTHDLALARSVLDRLPNAEPNSPVSLPRFSKTLDDRLPLAECPRVASKPDIVLVDNWFWAIQSVADAQLLNPLNRREAVEDDDCRWRRYVNQQIDASYVPFFSLAQAHVHLQAPSWEQSIQWRLEQQAQLLGQEADALASNEQQKICWFLQLFERIGRLPMNPTPDVTVKLSPQHGVAQVCFSHT